MQEVRPVSTSEDAASKLRDAYHINGVDTETALPDETCACPPLACMTVFIPDEQGNVLHEIYGHKDAPAVFEWMMRRALAEGITIVANHLPYDIVELMNEAPYLIPLIFACLDRGLFECDLLREKLDDIAQGRYIKKEKQRIRDLGDGRKLYTYSLAETMQIRCGITLNKDDDTWRKRFGELRPFPVSMWPQQAVSYAKDDAKAHWLVAMQQEADEQKAPALAGYYVYADAPAQTRMGVCLQLMRVKGIRTDPIHTTRLKNTLIERRAKVLDRLVATKFLRARKWQPRKEEWKDESKDTKKIKAAIILACTELGQLCKTTLKNERNQPVWMQPNDIIEQGYQDKVSMDKEQLEALEEAKGLFDLIEWNKTERALGYTEILESGFTHAIHSEPNTLVENGRISWGSESPDGATSAKTVNLTNLPTERGVRECYIPLAGNLFFAVDFATLELCAVAQVCLWLGLQSRLAELINQRIDMHCLLGSMFLTQMGQPITYEEFYARYKAGDEFIKDEIRDAAKKANFGFWGGMGIDRFMTQHRELKLPREKVVLLKETWQDMLPETRPYFKLCGNIQETSGTVVQFLSNRIRTGIDFCAIANTFFSGLAADMAKEACYCITRAMYAEPDSPCFGAWLDAFIHDEYLGEAPEHRAPEVAEEVKRIAEVVAKRKLPDVPPRCSVSLMRRWRKGASAYYVDGRLRPYEDSPEFQKLLQEGKAFL